MLETADLDYCTGFNSPPARRENGVAGTSDVKSSAQVFTAPSRRSRVSVVCGYDGRPQEEDVLRGGLLQAAVIWAGGEQEGGVLLTARRGRDGRRGQQDLWQRGLLQAGVVWTGG